MDTAHFNRITKLAANLVATLGEPVTIYLAEMVDADHPKAGKNRVAGTGPVQNPPRWGRLQPTSMVEPMTHALTLDLSTVRALPTKYHHPKFGEPAVHAIAVYVHNPDEYSGMELDDGETCVVPVGEDAYVEPTEEPGSAFVLHPVVVPAALFMVPLPDDLAAHDDALSDLRSDVFKWRPGYVGGLGVIGLDQQDGHFLLMWWDLDTNLGDGGALVVYEEGGFCAQ